MEDRNKNYKMYYLYISHNFFNWLWLILKNMFVKKEGGEWL